MSEALVGVAHLHSTYSDGEFSLSELRRVLVADGCRFAIMTDHAEAFTDATLSRYLKELAFLSDSSFLFVPGLEHTCERGMHVLSVGRAALEVPRDPERAFAHIHASGGLSVIAHPRQEHFAWIESFATRPSAIEVWNTKYDGPLTPRPQTFALLRRMQDRTPQLAAFYGLDLHWKVQRRLLRIRARAPLSVAGILCALRTKDYQGEMHGTLLPAHGYDPAEAGQKWGVRSRAFFMWRNALRSIYRASRSAGISVPPALKAQLRRLIS